MGMNVATADDEDEVVSAINTTPLVDVMLVLLIIFLITIPVVTQTVAVDLPKETNQPRLTKPENIKDFYRNNELIDLTRELTEMRRKNRTIDWQKKETARASMRKMVKHLLKKYKYPPEDYDTAISTVISQCEMWTDNMTA